MKMQSGPGYLDMDEAIEWIAAESKELREPIPIEVVSEVLCLWVEFQPMVGYAVLGMTPSGDPAIIPLRVDDDAIEEALFRPWCDLGSGTTPPERGRSEHIPQ